jgi:hypothetical protein
MDISNPGALPLYTANLTLEIVENLGTQVLLYTIRSENKRAQI